MTFSIRRATENDWEAWWDLRKRALRDHPDAFGSSHAEAEAMSPDMQRDRFIDFYLAQEGALFVATDERGALVGTTGLRRESGRKSAHRVMIWGVYVAPEARGQRVARQLLDAAIAHARQQPGVLQIELAVSSHNRNAVQLYEHAGFVRYGRHPRALLLDGVGIDEELMVLILDSTTSTA